MDDNTQQQLAHQLEIEQREQEEKSIFINSDLDRYIKELRLVRTKIKSWQQEEKDILFMISEIIKDKEVVFDPCTGEVVATYKPQTRQTFDMARFKEECPMLAKHFSKETVVRTFLIKQKESTNE